MADYVYPRFATSFPGLLPLKLGGPGMAFFPALGTRLQGSVEYQWSAEWNAFKVEKGFRAL